MEVRTMPLKPRKPREYRFEIDAFTPDTIPLARLSQYLADVAKMMGQESSVHLRRIAKGSTVPIIQVEWEAEPKVREQLHAVQANAGPAEARRAYKQINKRLVEDNANGVLLDPSSTKVIRFPGRDGANQPHFGPFAQPGVFQGILIELGGKNDPVPVHLSDGDEIHIVSAPRRIAKQLAPHLFTSVIRVEGNGRWQRNRMGDWEMLGFQVARFDVLPDGSLKDNVEALRAIPGAWKNNDDPLGDLVAIRTGERPQ
jgi:hypothetical protein